MMIIIIIRVQLKTVKRPVGVHSYILRDEGRTLSSSRRRHLSLRVIISSAGTRDGEQFVNSFINERWTQGGDTSGQR